MSDELKSGQINTKLEPATERRLRSVADTLGMTMSEIVRQLLTEHLVEYELRALRVTQAREAVARERENARQPVA